MKVNRAVADAATTEVRDERFAELVQQRATEKNRDTARTGVRVDVDHVGRHNAARVENQFAGLVAIGHGYAVNFEQAAHDANVADGRHIAQNARAVTENRGNHGLGDEVL